MTLDHSIRRFAVTLGLALLGAAAAPAQAPDPAAALLRNAANRYAKAESFYFVATEKTVTQAGSLRREVQTMVLTAKNPDGRLRVEFDDRVNGGVGVFDGKDSWGYIPSLGKYAKLPWLDNPQPGQLDYATLVRRFVDRYRGAADRVIGADILRQETLGLQGGEVVCQVLQVAYDPPPGMREGKIERLYWIAESSGLIVQERSLASMLQPNSTQRVEVIQEIDFQVARADEPLDDSLFIFAPPPGAREVESFDDELSASGEPTDTTAPDFSLGDLNGGTQQLSDLRGQVVLLDFWATWCGPCRYDMPVVEELSKQYADKGLKVFGVNSESPDRAKAYLSDNGITFPTLYDHGMNVHKIYRIRAIPAFLVIDRQGRIASYLQGTRSKQQLEEALLAAGL